MAGKKIIIANWKMNPSTLAEAKDLFNAVKREAKKIDNVDIIIAPPAIWLGQLKTSENDNISLAAQNMHWEEKGAFTGEISPLMIKEMNVKYVIIGHSERRIYFGESDETVNAKILAAFKNNLAPILCVGETLEERLEDKVSEAVKTQIEKALNEISKEQIESNKIIIAYEPVWAIGSDLTPSFDDILSAKLLIKKIIASFYDRKISDKISILYGGSVNGLNAKNILNKGGMDGLLAGMTSLKANEFYNIIKEAKD